MIYTDRTFAEIIKTPQFNAKMFGRSSSANFDKLLENATSHMLLEPDWTLILQICDCIRQQDVLPKYAVGAIKKKLYNSNPHVALYAFQVLESCVKNCGAPIHQEIVSRQFMEELRELIKVTPHETVKAKILELIQAWAHAFRQEPNYRAVQDTMNLMKMEGFKFPALKESDAMFVADQAPEWADGDCCHRCRVTFSVVQRRHHCRNCGQIFCAKCSSKNSAIPKFGIEKEVRVCEACFEKINKSVAAAANQKGSEQSSPITTQQKEATPGGKTSQDLQEEEDLQLAIALSKSEAETKDKSRSKLGNLNNSTYSSLPSSMKSDSGLRKESGGGGSNGEGPENSELARYLNRSYWEQKQQEELPSSTNRTSPIPSAPFNNTNPAGNNINTVGYSPSKVSDKFQKDHGSEEMDIFLNNLETTLEIFVNRMKSNQSRGRPIANDTYVQSLFMNITNMHSQLLKYIQEQDDLRMHFEGLQDKLNQARDARAALDALREEHRERLRREAEEAERIRQIQMAHKLEIMRKKKQEYLQYQRQIALQRIQEQEREMQMRQEQQKQQYMMQGGGGPPPQGPPPSTVYGPHPQQQQQQAGMAPFHQPPQGGFHPSPHHHHPQHLPHHPHMAYQGGPFPQPQQQQPPQQFQPYMQGLGSMPNPQFGPPEAMPQPVGQRIPQQPQQMGGPLSPGALPPQQQAAPQQQQQQQQQHAPTTETSPTVPTMEPRPEEASLISFD